MRVLTGIQASGKLHIGNYFGAMKPMVELQEETIIRLLPLKMQLHLDNTHKTLL